MDERWCKKPGICGRDVIRESAYCYVEGSFCQRWVHRKIRGSQEEDIDGEYNEPLSASPRSSSKEYSLLFIIADIVLDEFELNPNMVDSFIPEKNSHTWKCGVPQKTSPLSYFTRIIGGRPSTPRSWPWQVAVLNRFRVSSSSVWNCTSLEWGSVNCKSNFYRRRSVAVLWFRQDGY